MDHKQELSADEIIDNLLLKAFYWRQEAATRFKVARKQNIVSSTRNMQKRWPS